MEKAKLYDNAPLVDAIEITPVPGGTVEVVAPMDLREGYELQVQVNGERKCVLIPPGGVLEGQSFQAQPFSDSSLVHQIPVGRWRDGLCDCLRFGCCHAVCCLGFWWEPGEIRFLAHWCFGSTKLGLLTLLCRFQQF
jgi:hypothetical protein